MGIEGTCSAGAMEGPDTTWCSHSQLDKTQVAATHHKSMLHLIPQQHALQGQLK